MIELVLQHRDVALIRFAHSPVRELVGSAVTLHEPARQPIHRRWLDWVRPRLRGNDFDLLFAVTPYGQYYPDFLTPDCSTGSGDLAEELARIGSTGPDVVRGELDEMARTSSSGILPSVARPLYDDPERHLDALVDQMRRYWELALKPVWSRLLAVATDDISYRLQQCADVGIGPVLNELSEHVTYRDDVVGVSNRYACRHDVAGDGLILYPCVFAWPKVSVTCCGNAQPAIAYAPRGVGTVWEDRGRPERDPLRALIGRTRAALLDEVALPVTTTQLAIRLRISAAAVSQHLHILKAAGLVSSRRQGRLVLYQRTAAGTVLLDAARRRADPARPGPGSITALG